MSDKYPYYCVEPECGISDCTECPFNPVVLQKKIKALESVLKEWIDWTLESFNAGVNDEYLEKLKQIKKKLSAKDDHETGISRKIKIGEKEYPYERGEDGSIIIDLEKYRKEQASGGVPNVDMKGNYLSDSKPPEPIEKQRNMKLLESQGILYCQSCGEDLRSTNKIYTINHYECLKKEKDKLIGEFNDDIIKLSPTQLKEKWEARSK